MAFTTVFNPLESLVAGAANGLVIGMAKTVGPATYADGGFAVDFATDEGLNNDPFFVVVSPGSDTNGTPNETTNVLDYVAHYDYANKKILVYDPADGSEAIGDNLSSVYFYCGYVAQQG